MRFSINGIAPLASHFACLLLGFSLRWFQFKEDQPAMFPKAVALPLVKSGQLLDGKMGDSMRLYAEKGGTICYLANNRVGLLQVKPFVVLALKIDDARNVLDLMQRKHKILVATYHYQKLHASTACEQKSRISYGPASL